MNEYRRVVGGRVVAVSVLIISFLLSGCGSVPIADMSLYELHIPQRVEPLTSAVRISIDEVNLSHRKTGNPAVSKLSVQNLSDINARYAQAVGSLLFGSDKQDASPQKTSPQHTSLQHTSLKRAVLVLERVDVVQVAGKGFASFDISEQITATWRLYSPDRHRSYFSVSASGQASSQSGWGDSIARNSQQRVGQAYQQLLHDTLRVFAASPAMERFGLLSPIYLNPTDGVSIARRLLSSRAGDLSPLLEALRWVAVDLGLPELIDVSREVIASLPQPIRPADPALLHGAIRSSQFSDSQVIQLIDQVAALDQYNDAGMTPLEAALARGRDAVATALVSAGAKPVVRFSGNAYLSAEVSYRLIRLLKDTGLNANETQDEAIKQYQQAIRDANFAIEQNEASIFASRIVNVIGPVLQESMAIAEAKAKARASAKSSGFIGFGSAVYSPVRFDTDKPQGAISYLRDRIRHCERRLAELRQG